MKYRFLLLLCVLLPASAQAQSAEPTGLVVEGLEAYATRGTDAALEVWLTGWSAEDDAVARPQLRNLLYRFDEAAGAMLGHDIAGMASWGDRAGRIYAVMLYETQPIYARFDVFMPDSTWRIVNVTINTDPAQIFPLDMFVPR